MNTRIEDYDVIQKAQKVLPVILKSLRKNQKEVKLDKKLRFQKSCVTPMTLDGQASPFVSIKTNNCAHFLQGGCTMCAFKHNSNDTQKKTVDSQIKEAFEYLRRENRHNKRYFFGIGTGGSFFDDRELSPESRKKIYSNINRVAPQEVNAVLYIESRLDFINEKNINELKNSLGPNIKVALGYGLESTNPVIRDVCVNKRLPQNWTEKINILKRNNINVNAYIILKPPFLDEDEAVEDVLESVKTILELRLAHGISMMTMSVRKHTLVSYLHEQNRYKLPSIWSTIRIIDELGPDICEKIVFNGFVWTEDHKKILSEGGKTDDYIVVSGCRECNHILMPLIINLSFPYTKDKWKNIINTSKKINCQCKKDYLSRSACKSRREDLNKRLLDELNLLSKEFKLK